MNKNKIHLSILSLLLVFSIFTAAQDLVFDNNGKLVNMPKTLYKKSSPITIKCTTTADKELKAGIKK